ncbi:MAG: TrbC/VirB2 family protein [Candidatus Omnitrophica bacterium]|nr:TrbC/VirB2 family protein [Candidatus Omnitrophota bacterium]
MNKRKLEERRVKILTGITAWIMNPENQRKLRNIFAGICIAVAIVLAFQFLTGIAYASTNVNGAVTNFTDTIRSILVGPVAKTLCIGAFIAAAFFMLSGKWGAAISCVIAGILLGFANNIAQAIFNTTGNSSNW